MRKKRVAKLITYMCANLHAYGMIQPNVLAHTSRVFRCSYQNKEPINMAELFECDGVQSKCYWSWRAIFS